MSSAGSSVPELRRGVYPVFPRPDLRRGVYPVFLRPDGTFNPWDSEVEKGMTTLGFVLKEGIVIAADHPSGTKPNIVPLNHCMVATISGGKDRGRDISSFTSLINSLQSEAKHVTSVHNLLTWLADTISAKKEYYSSVGILIAVWNESERGLYKVNGDGVITENDILATGSGSAVTIMVKMKLKCIESGVSIPKAAEIAKTSICFVAYESPHYGDAVSVYHLGSEGFQKHFEEDMEEYQSQFPCIPRTQVIGKGW